MEDGETRDPSVTQAIGYVYISAIVFWVILIVFLLIYDWNLSHIGIGLIFAAPLFLLWYHHKHMRHTR